MPRPRFPKKSDPELGEVSLKKTSDKVVPYSSTSKHMEILGTNRDQMALGSEFL
jgi:hypothetical protein